VLLQVLRGIAERPIGSRAVAGGWRHRRSMCKAVCCVPELHRLGVSDSPAHRSEID
jgi:hypothetical protein